MTGAPARRPRGDPGKPPSARPDIAADADPYEVARAIVLRQLTDRARSRSELETKLASQSVPAEVAAAVLDRMEAVDLVNDAAFARHWVAARHRSRGLARRSLQLELHRKGIDPEQAAEALAELDPEREVQTARDLVERKLRATRGQEPASRARRLVGMLARKGYPAGIAYSVVREALAGEDVVVDAFDQID